jgi:hypothetical protein
VGLAIAVISAIAGIAGAFFAWVPVRKQLSRRRAARTPKPASASSSPSGSGGPVTADYDVFVSYSHDDKAWVTAFAEHLRREGLKVDYDEEFLNLGDVLVPSIEQAIRDSAHGILVFSPSSVESKWVKQEYATMMQRSIELGSRFIPVVIEDADLPEFARSHYYADFRNATGEKYDELIKKIVRAVRKPR